MAGNSDRSYYVYVIRLLPAVLDERKFAEANPLWKAGKPCVYVGQSVKPPRARYEEHVAGYKACRFVTRYHDESAPLIKRKCKRVDSRSEAEQWEVETARRLRNRGYAVWQR